MPIAIRWMVPNATASGCYEIRSIRAARKTASATLPACSFSIAEAKACSISLMRDICFAGDVFPGASACCQCQAAQFQSVEFLQHLVLHGHVRLRLKAEQFPASPEAGTELFS